MVQLQLVSHLYRAIRGQLSRRTFGKPARSQAHLCQYWCCVECKIVGSFECLRRRRAVYALPVHITCAVCTCTAYYVTLNECCSACVDRQSHTYWTCTLCGYYIARRACHLCHRRRKAARAESHACVKEVWCLRLIKSRWPYVTDSVVFGGSVAILREFYITARVCDGWGTDKHPTTKPFHATKKPVQSKLPSFFCECREIKRQLTMYFIYITPHKKSWYIYSNLMNTLNSSVTTLLLRITTISITTGTTFPFPSAYDAQNDRLYHLSV